MHGEKNIKELLLFSNCADMYCLGLSKIRQICVGTKGRIQHQLLDTACCESNIRPASKQMSLFYRPDWFTSIFTSVSLDTVLNYLNPFNQYF
jgi:hypothetical protein